MIPGTWLLDPTVAHRYHGSFAEVSVRLLRISAAPYNDRTDYDRMLAALANEL